MTDQTSPELLDNIRTLRSGPFALRLAAPGRPVVALAGNPNTGKSTVFNALTGLRQHTGNWPGKTVVRSEGLSRRGGHEMVLVDLPGTYSLLATSPDEIIARDFICFARPEATVVVVDVTCLERNLNLVLQVAEITPRVVVCLNLVDEARRTGVDFDECALERELGLPVVPTVARDGWGLDSLAETVWRVTSGNLVSKPRTVRYSPCLEQLAADLAPDLATLVDGQVNRRWFALRLLEGDQTIISSIGASVAGRGSHPPPADADRTPGGS